MQSFEENIMGVNSINNSSFAVNSLDNSSYNVTASTNLKTYSGKIHQDELDRQGADEVSGSNAR